MRTDLRRRSHLPAPIPSTIALHRSVRFLDSPPAQVEGRRVRRCCRRSRRRSMRGFSTHGHSRDRYGLGDRERGCRLRRPCGVAVVSCCSWVCLCGVSSLPSGDGMVAAASCWSRTQTHSVGSSSSVSSGHRGDRCVSSSEAWRTLRHACGTDRGAVCGLVVPSAVFSSCGAETGRATRRGST